LKVAFDVLARRVSIEPGSIIFAASVHVRGDHFEIPSTPGPDFDDSHVGLETEESQGFFRMARRVSIAVSVRAMIAGKDGLEGRNIDRCGRRFWDRLLLGGDVFGARGLGLLRIAAGRK